MKNLGKEVQREGKGGDLKREAKDHQNMHKILTHRLRDSVWKAARYEHRKAHSIGPGKDCVR